MTAESGGDVTDLKSPRFILPLAILSMAILVRLWHHYTVPVDWYGDSYHHWLISRLTLENGFRYSDFKPVTHDLAFEPLNLVWLPLYSYFSAALMALTGINGLFVPHILNIVFGSLTALFVYHVILTQASSRAFASVGGFMVAFQPWMAGVDVLGLTEPLSILLMLASFACYLKRNDALLAASLALGMLVRYENWFFALVIALVGFLERRFTLKRLGLLGLAPAMIALLWSWWSYSNTGDLLFWLRAETITTRHLASKVVGAIAFPGGLLRIFWRLNEVTSGLFTIALVGSLLRTSKALRSALLVAAILSVERMLEFQSGTSLGEERFALEVVPFVAILVAILLHDISRAHKFSKPGLLAILLMLSVVPMLAQIWIFPAKAYIVNPEIRTGVWIGDHYSGGRIIADSPTVIYYSRIGLSRFLSGAALLNVEPKPSPASTASFLCGEHVSYLVWEDVPFSPIPEAFRQLSQPSRYTLGSVAMQPVYVDRGWEHSYGAPPISVFRVVCGLG